MTDITTQKKEQALIQKLEKRLAREKSARQQAESILENRSRELYQKFKDVSKNAKLMEAAIVNAKDGVIITTADLDNGPEIVYVNDAFTRISGYEKDEVIGKTPRMLQGAGTSRDVLDELRTCLKKGKSFKGELQNYTKDGIAYWLDISIVPVRDEDNNITHFTAIERDITERKAFEKEMQIHREAAEVANRAKDDFLANMSHELRTPMNGIIGLSELMLDMHLSDEQVELTRAIHGSSRNLLILLNDILDLSKIEANELTLEEISFDTRRVVHQTIELLRNTAHRKGIKIDATINPIVPDRVMGDPARFQQIMNNLVNNAIKFTEEGYVRLDLTSFEDNMGDPVLRMRVEDTGIGIPEEKQGAIFNKFTQADVSTARKYGGTGLGLAITKDLVEIMGGEISVQSVEGRGTTFYAEIPFGLCTGKNVTIDDIQSDQDKSTALFDFDTPILAVDDHPVNLLFISKVLKKIGFTHVDEAGSGSKALALYEKTKYPLIFMDCQMPEMDGFETSAHIRDAENYSNDTKIIAVTADAMKGAKERCIDSGMNDYISKPVDIEKLKSVLAEWLGKASQSHVPKAEGPEGMIEDDVSCDTISSEDGVIDWDRLALFTDGDLEEEKALIDLFVTYAEESLTDLHDAMTAADGEQWQKAAHKLKGSAANLGAQNLADICLEAENGAALSHDDKQSIYAAIQNAYCSVTNLISVRHRG